MCGSGTGGTASFIKRLRDFQLEAVEQDKFRKFERLVAVESYTVSLATQINPSLGNLVAWIKGVHEFHRFLRGYSLSEADEHILSKEEVNFCR